jgi:ferrous iron transport protein B
MVFTLLYVPCVATMAAIKQESGSWKFVSLVILIELTTAWVVAFIIYYIANFTL